MLGTAAQVEESTLSKQIQDDQHANVCWPLSAPSPVGGRSGIGGGERPDAAARPDCDAVGSALAQNPVPHALQQSEPAAITGVQDTSTSDPRLEQSVRRVANSLTGTIIETVLTLERHAAAERANVGQTAQSAVRALEEIQQWRADFTSGLESKLESLAMQLAELRSMVCSAQDHLGRHETSVVRIEGRFTELETAQNSGEELTTSLRAALTEAAEKRESLEDRLTAAEKQSLAQTQELNHLRLACDRIDRACSSSKQLILAQEAAIERLEQASASSHGLVGRFLTALRSVDLRGDPRISLSSEMVKVILPGDQDVATRAFVQDVSRNGMGLTLEVPVEVGSELRVEVGDREIVGKVCHCRASGSEYAVGLAFLHPLQIPGVGEVA